MINQPISSETVIHIRKTPGCTAFSKQIVSACLVYTNVFQRDVHRWSFWWCDLVCCRWMHLHVCNWLNRYGKRLIHHWQMAAKMSIWSESKRWPKTILQLIHWFLVLLMEVSQQLWQWSPVQFDGQQVKQETNALTESSSDLHIAVLSVGSSLQKV